MADRTRNDATAAVTGMADSRRVSDAPLFSRRWRWALRLFGPVVLLLLLRRLDMTQIIPMIAGADGRLLFLAVALTMPFFALKIWRWRVILRALGIEISGGQALQLYGAGLFIGQVTPGQLGELVRAPLLWRRGHSPWLVASSVALDRVLDLLLLVLVAMPVLVLFPRGWLVVFAATGLTVVSVGMWPWGRGRLAAASNHHPGLHAALDEIDQIITMLRLMIRTRGAAPVVSGTTLFALALNFLRFYVLLLALRLTLPVSDFIVGVALASLAGLLPITVAGIGTRDMVLAVMFQRAGQPVEGAVAFSAMILVVAYGLNLIWGGPAWLRETR